MTTKLFKTYQTDHVVFNVPAKIKIFGWRVLHGLIPCRGILANRRIDNSSSCPACHEGCEDIKHVLFTCSRAKEIWRILGVANEIQNLLRVDRSGSVVLAEMIKVSRPLGAMNHVGLAESSPEDGTYGGNAGGLFMEKLFKIRQELPCRLQH